ncbi:mucin-20 isoform X2 [Antechinus flavipes]|uniref:mucin-20 isoform X2 n=1 Tax=Antechinus flavipes TaxID=38775 RepID=UPI002235B6DE|nr:mucin-20 isoform X2 [Antechinus flavipes]
MGPLLWGLGLLLFFLHCVVGITTQSSTGPDDSSSDQLVKISNPEITVTPGGLTTSERIFGTTQLYETSAVTHTPLKFKTSLDFENLALARTAYKAETKIAESFPPTKTLIIIDTQDKTDTTILLESSDPTLPSVTMVSESGTDIGKTPNQAQTLKMVFSAAEAEITKMESLVSANAWPGMSNFQRVVWKSSVKTYPFPLAPHPNHGKHRHRPIRHRDYVNSVTGHPWTSPLNSSIPENQSSIKTPTFTELMTTTGTFTESELSNPFRTIVRKTSGITTSPETEAVIIEEIIPFTLLAEFTEIAEITSGTLEREGTPVRTTALPGTLTTFSPITDTTEPTSHRIDAFPRGKSIQDTEMTPSVTLSMALTNAKAKATTPEMGTSAETSGSDNKSLPQPTGGETTLTPDIPGIISTEAKTAIPPGTSVTIDSSVEEETSSLFKTALFSETSAASSSAEQESSADGEVFTLPNRITMVGPTSAETPNAAESLDPTGHTGETTAKMATDTLETIYTPTTEKTLAPMETTVFTEVPDIVTVSMEEKSTITKVPPPAESSDTVYTTPEGTTAQGHDGGFLLLRLVVSSSLDLTDVKVAKELLNKLHQDLLLQVPYTQISLIRVTRG